MDFPKYPKYFDTIEVSLITDICSTREDLMEIRTAIEKLDPQSVSFEQYEVAKKKIRDIKILLISLESIPAVKFLVRYDYFRFHPPLQKINIQ